MGESFAPFKEDFLRITADVAYHTYDRRRQRQAELSRGASDIRVSDGQPVEWLVSWRTPVKTSHLTRNLYVSCS